MWSGSAGWRWCIGLTAMAASLVFGCDEKQPAPRTAELGASCERAEDCASRLCVTLTGAVGAVCSMPCDADADCPAANWACTSTSGAAQKACACTKLGASEACQDGLDNDCDARTDCQACASATGSLALECGGVCVDSKTDSNNCGGCGLACDFGQTCRDGACGCPASGPGDFCAGVGCIDLLANELNCGACGVACDLGRSCIDGSCQCPVETTVCGGNCVDTATDSANCGECGNACGPGLTCVDSACSCPPGDHALCGADCSDLTADPRHCGSCANACRAGEACAGAECTCASGLYCGDVCMQADDQQNCGACGNACPAGQVCSRGSCACQGATLTACGTECVSLPSDESHCGNCAAQCGSTEVCDAGECVCPSGNSYCASSDSCVALTSDAKNCGACGHSCAPSEVCVGSKCVCPAANQQYCSALGSCVDVLSSNAHCGSCDVACKDPLSCVQGECGCAAGKAFCAGSNICADLQSDQNNCGACGNACPSGAHCAGGQCACDSASQTLCGDACRDLKTDPLACGACERACGGSYGCVAGACRCPQPTLGKPTLVASQLGDQALALAWDGKHVGLAYYRFVPIQDQNIHFVLLNADGSVVPSSDRLIAHYWTDFDVVSPGDGYAIAYDDGHAGTIVFQRLDATGKSNAVAQDLRVGSIDHLRLAWSKVNGYYLAYGNTFSDGDSTISNWTIPLGADGTSASTAWPWGFGGRPFVSNFLAGDDGTLGLLLNNSKSSRFLTMDSMGGTILPVAQLTSDYTFQTGAVGYDSAGYFEIWPLFHSIYVNRGVQMNQPLSFVDIGANNSLRGLTMAQAAQSVALGWTWTAISASASAPSTFTLQRFGPPDAQSGAIQAITSAVDLTKNSTNYARIVSTGTNSLLAVWSTREHDLYAMPIDFNACP